MWNLVKKYERPLWWVALVGVIVFSIARNPECAGQGEWYWYVLPIVIMIPFFIYMTILMRRFSKSVKGND